MTELGYYMLQQHLIHASAWSMLLWAIAYYLFPFGLYRIEKKVLRQTDVQVYGEHITGTRKFVIWCGHSHVCMWAMMLTHDVFNPGVFEIGISVIAFSVFLIGGLFSLYRAWRLWIHVPALATSIVGLINATAKRE